MSTICAFLNAVSTASDQLASAGAAWAPWLPWRWSSALGIADVDLDGVDYRVEGGSSLMGLSMTGPVDPRVSASGFGPAARSAMAPWA